MARARLEGCGRAAAVLDDPAANFALKAVLKAWLRHDLVDAANNAERL